MSKSSKKPKSNSKLTRGILAALPVSPPSSTKTFAWDNEIRGLGAYRTGNQSISFVYQYAMPGGKTKSLMFAKFGEVTLEQARTRGAGMAYQRRLGNDPIAMYRAQLKEASSAVEILIKHYAADYIERRRKQGKPLNVAQTAIIIRDIIGVLGEERMDQITVAQVEDFADEIGQRGVSSRRMGLVYLNAILNDAVRRDVIERNVAKKVEIPKAGVRSCRLREDEMQRFLEAAHDMGDCRGDIYEVLARTLKRKEEISRMQWSELNIPKREWSLDQSKTKGRTSHVIELPRQVMEIILRQQPDPKLRVGPVFTLDGGKTSPELGSQVKDILDAHLHKRLEAANERDGTTHGFAHYTIHDLRTTGASRLQEKPFQFNTALIDAILLHQTGNAVTRTYQWARLEIEAGEALQRWNDFLDALMSGDSAWPGGRDRMLVENGAERKDRLAALRADWPLREDQKRAAARRAEKTAAKRKGA